MEKQQLPEKYLSRRDFLQQVAGAALLFSTACLFCSNRRDTAEEASLPVTLSPEQKAQLDSTGFLNITGIIVIKDGASYRAFSRTCPHEGGTVTALSPTSLQCQRHTDQYYNNHGQGNGARTSASLRQYTVTDNGGTLTIS